MTSKCDLRRAIPRSRNCHFDRTLYFKNLFPLPHQSKSASNCSTVQRSHFDVRSLKTFGLSGAAIDAESTGCSMPLPAISTTLFKHPRDSSFYRRNSLERPVDLVSIVVVKCASNLVEKTFSPSFVPIVRSYTSSRESSILSKSFT